MPKPTRQPATQAAPPPESFALSDAVKEKIQAWLSIRKGLEELQAAEATLRQEIAKIFFPNPKEGSNRILGKGFEIKLTHKVSRILDEASLDAVMLQLPADKRVIPGLIRLKPTLSLEFYKSLPPSERKIFDQALTIKDDGLPQVEVTLADEHPHPEMLTRPDTPENRAADRQAEHETNVELHGTANRGEAYAAGMVAQKLAFENPGLEIKQVFTQPVSPAPVIATAVPKLEKASAPTVPASSAKKSPKTSTAQPKAKPLAKKNESLKGSRKPSKPTKSVGKRK